MCAAYGAKDSGDARQALDLLLEAGDLARERNDAVVTEAHVKEARTRLQTDQVIEGIRNYSDHGQFVLYALTVLAERDAIPARTKDVLQTYKQIATEEGLDPVSERSVRDYLRELEQLGIISATEYNKGKRGGKYKEYQFEQSIPSIEEGLSELLEPTR